MNWTKRKETKKQDQQRFPLSAVHDGLQVGKANTKSAGAGDGPHCVIDGSQVTLKGLD